MSDITIIATGGTIDKVYYDAKSDYRIGDPQVSDILQQAGVQTSYEVVSLLRKDSLELNDADRTLIRQTVLAQSSRLILITHGTDSMVDTAQALGDCGDKTVVLVGATAVAGSRIGDRSFKRSARLQSVRAYWPRGYPVNVVMQS